MPTSTARTIAGSSVLLVTAALITVQVYDFPPTTFDLATEIAKCERAAVTTPTNTSSVTAACAISVPAGVWEQPGPVTARVPVNISGVPLSDGAGGWVSVLGFQDGGLTLLGRDSRLSNLTLRGVLRKGNVGAGLSVRAKFHIENVLVTRFSGAGFDADVLGAAGANINLSQTRNLRAVRNGGPGVRVRGADTNGMVYAHIDSRQNCWFTSGPCANIWSSGFLGSAWIAPETHTCYVGGLTPDEINATSGGPACQWGIYSGKTQCICRSILFDNEGAADAIFFPYAEKDQLPPKFVHTTVTMGGVFSAGVEGEALHLRRGMPVKFGVGGAPSLVFGASTAKDQTVQWGYGGRPPAVDARFDVNDIWLYEDSPDKVGACVMARLVKVVTGADGVRRLTWRCVSTVGEVVQ